MKLNLNAPKNGPISECGFTLIETMVTLFIMAILTVLATRTIKEAFINKAKIQNKMDLVAQVKDTLRLMERDIELAYHYQDLQKDLADELLKAQNKNKKKTPSAPPGSGGMGGSGSSFIDDLNSSSNDPTKNGKNPFFKTENRVDPTTQFIAKENEFHFVTMNSVRVMKNSPQADFSEVSYYVSECKNRPDKNFETGKCLFRRFSPIVDTDVTKGGTSTQLLYDVTEFQLKFFSKIQKDWRSDWDSTERGDINTKGRYPEAVEINITTETPIKDSKGNSKKKKVSIQSLVPIHFPNNKDETSNDSKKPL